MELVILFDPSIRSWNTGDEVIMRSAEKELKNTHVLDDKFVVHCATHAPAVTWYQNNKANPHMKIYDHAKYKFICGSNLLWKNMRKPLPSLNVNLWNSRPYRDSILFGVGTGLAHEKSNLYTKKLYRRILSENYIHSVRDEKTAEFVRSLGFRALDTGCPTMWRFTPEFCQDIPCEQGQNVIFTLTDYACDREYDQKVLDLLLECYHKVFFWPQGFRDMDYFSTLDHTNDIQVLNPGLASFEKVLARDDVEYVGTRLHGGMFAMQHKKRTIVLSVDQRARNFADSFVNNIVERSDIQILAERIVSSFATEAKIKQDNISTWQAQFL